MTYGPKENRIEGAKLLEPVGRHHLACSEIGVAAPVELAPLE